MAGYQEAASLSAWRLLGSASDDTFSLIAKVEKTHPVWASYVPQELELQMPEGGTWRWTVESPTGATAGSEVAVVLVGLPKVGGS